MGTWVGGRRAPVRRWPSAFTRRTFGMCVVRGVVASAVVGIFVVVIAGVGAARSGGRQADMHIEVG